MLSRKDKRALVAAGLPEHITPKYLQAIRNTRLWNALCSLYGTEPLLRRFNGTDTADSTDSEGGQIAQSHSSGLIPPEGERTYK